jgi:hypothetical protein
MCSECCPGLDTAQAPSRLHNDLTCQSLIGSLVMAMK